MRVTRITVTDPTDILLPVRDVIEMSDHGDAVKLLADPMYAERFQREGWKVDIAFVDVLYCGPRDSRDADVGVNGGRGW
jgi:hypothetical protein